ncbi:MAG TPA: dienelactone hydrolase family protein [Methylomirabilota bacterium]
MTTTATPARFRERTIAFADGVTGRNLDIPSASPLNYHQAISAPADMPRTLIDGKLFLPLGAARGGRWPLVIVVPGSLGVDETHLAHAETLTGSGLAVFVLDSFGARGITSTVTNQTQYSFAASAWDVLAAWRVLSTLSEIDATRIGAQGHSRGGSAVLTAATRRFADAVLGPGLGPVAVLAAYPWSGHQFLDPAVGATRIRVLMGDRDDWCSVQQVQGHVHAIRLTGGAVSLRLFGGAAHSFDRPMPVVRIADARVAPGGPTAYLDADGAYIHPLTGRADARLTDRDMAVYNLKAGYGVRGASFGGTDAEAAGFRDDMLAFWSEALRA